MSGRLAGEALANHGRSLLAEHGVVGRGHYRSDICKCGDRRGDHRGGMCFAGYRVGMKQTPCACDEFRAAAGMGKPQ